MWTKEKCTCVCVCVPHQTNLPFFMMKFSFSHSPLPRYYLFCSFLAHTSSSSSRNIFVSIAIYRTTVRCNYFVGARREDKFSFYLLIIQHVFCLLDIFSAARCEYVDDIYVWGGGDGVEKVCFIKHYTVIMLSERESRDDDYDDMRRTSRMMRGYI